MASMTPPKSNMGTPQRPEAESEDIALGSPSKKPIKEKRGNGSSTDGEEEEDGEKYTELERQQLEDDLLSPASSAGSDIEKAAMEKELEEQGLIRRPEDSSLQLDPSGKTAATPTKSKSKGARKDQSLPEGEIVSRWNREFGDVCVISIKA